MSPAVRVLSYNIRYDTPTDPVAWAARRTHIAALLQNLAPSAFGLKEVLAQQLADLVEALPEYAHVGVGRGPDRGDAYAPESGEYNPIFYRRDRLALLDSGTFWLSSTPQKPGSRYGQTLPRIATWAQLEDKTTRQRFCVVNTHFPYEAGAGGEAARAFSARVLLRELERVAGTEPTILTGDFNFAADHEPDRRQTYAQLLGRFDDSFSTAARRSGPDGTFVGFAVAQPSAAPSAAKRIDYIFVERGVRILNYETVSAHDGTHHFSDHLPIFADLELG